jgi:hypothetical protein
LRMAWSCCVKNMVAAVITIDAMNSASSISTSEKPHDRRAVRLVRT